MAIKTFVVQGRRYDIQRSNRKDKKYKVEVNGKVINFGAKGYRMFPGQKRGQNYCARSSGIKGTNDINSANFWARKMWLCEGKKSIRRE